MKKTKRPTEQELLHQWLEGDLDLTQQLYVEKDEPQPEAVEPISPSGIGTPSYAPCGAPYGFIMCWPSCCAPCLRR